MPTALTTPMPVEWRSNQDRYAFLDRFFTHEQQRAGDPAMVPQAVQALIDLGLGGPARELLDRFADATASDPTITQIRQRVASVPTGRAALSESAAVFDRNLDALLTREEACHVDPCALRERLRHLIVFRDVEGRRHVCRRDGAAPARWVPALSDFADIAQTPIRAGAPDRSVAIVGLTPGDFVERVHAATQTAPNAQRVPLFLIEPELDRLAAWLHDADHVAVLSDPRACIFAGAAALQRLSDYLTQHEDVAVPAMRYACRMTPAVAAEFDAIAQRLNAARREAYDAVVQQLHSRSCQRTNAQCATRLAPGSVIMGFASRFTTMIRHSMRDIGNTLESMGYRFEFVTEADDHRHTSALTIARAIETHDPSLLIMVNHFRCEQSEVFADVPILTWIQDPMPNVLSRATGTSLRDRDFVCGYYREQCTDEFGYPADRFYPANFIPVSVANFSEHETSIDETSVTPCHALYVGHFSGTPESHTHSLKSQYPTSLHPLLDDIAAEVSGIIHRGAHPAFHAWDALVRSSASRVSITLPDQAVVALSQYHAYRLFDIQYRQATLFWIAQWAMNRHRTFRIHGRGWESHPVLGRFAAGPIEHGEALRLAHCNAKLVIQPIPSGFWHQRSFEALADGALIVARYSPWDFFGLPIAEYYNAKQTNPAMPGTPDRFPGLERILFGSYEQFDELAERLLRDDTQRAQLRQEFRAPVVRDMTYDAVLPDLMNRIRHSLAQPSSA